MDIKKLNTTIVDFLKKHRYSALVLAIGILLMVLPGREASIKAEEMTEPVQVQEESIEERLAQILCRIDGAGKVEVMLTEANGEEMIYQINEDRVESESETTVNIETVILTDADRNETALIRQVNPPRYLGVIIVCQGADSASVRLALVDAVSKITGLGSDCISVLKMK